MRPTAPRSEAPAAAPPPSAGPPPRRRWPWILVLAPLLAAIAGAAWLGSDAGGRWIAATAVEQINARIAGRAALERVAISLDGIRLEGAAVWAPGAEAPVIEVGRLHVAPAIGLRLLRGRVRIHEARIEEARVALELPAGEGESNLAAAFAPRAPSVDDGEGGGAAAWEVIVDHLSLARGALTVRTAGEPQVALDGLELELSGRADGDGAAVEATLSAAVAAPVRAPVALEIAGALRDGYRAIDLARLDGRVGGSTVVLRDGAADLATLAAEVEALSVRLLPADVPRLVEGWAPTVPLRLEGTARFEDGSLVARVAVIQELQGEEARLDLDAAVQPVARTWRLRARGAALDPRGFDGRAPAGAVDLGATLDGVGAEEIAGTIELPALRLGEGRAGPIRLEGAWRGGAAEVRALAVAVGGADLQASGRADAARADLRFDLRVRDARRLAAEAARLAAAAGAELPGLPALRGDVAVGGTVRGPWSAPAIAGTIRSGAFILGATRFAAVDGTLDVEGPIASPTGLVALRAGELEAGGTRIDRLAADLHFAGRHVRGTVEGATPAGRIRADLDLVPDAAWEKLRFDRLDLRWPRAGWSLGAPLVLDLADGVAVRGLALRSAGGATVDGDARLSARGALAVDLRVAGLDLALLPAAIAPAELGLGGTAAAEVRLEGTTARPKGELHLRLADGALLGVGGVGLDTRLHLDGRQVQAKVQASRGEARLEGDATLAWPIAARGALQIDARIAQLDLAELSRLLALDEPIAGRLGGTVALEGSLAAPRGTVDLQGSALGAAGIEGISARVQAVLGDDLSVRVEARHEASTLAGTFAFARSAAALAQDPAAILDAPLRGEVAVRGVRLAKWIGGEDEPLGIRGTVDLDGELAGSARAPRGEVHVALVDAWNGRAGPLDAEVTLDLGDDASSLRIDSRLLGRPFLQGVLAVGAAVERLADPATLGRAALSGEIAARDLDLGAVAWAAGFRSRAEGLVDGSFRLGGTAGAPVFALRTELSRLNLGNVPVGTMRIEADYAERSLSGVASLEADAGGDLRLRGAWPVDLSAAALAQGSLATLAGAPLDVELIANALDLTMLEGLSEDLRQSAGRLDGRVRVTGALPIPTLEGGLALREGHFGYTGYGDVRDVVVELEFQPDAIRLRRLDATAAGTLHASGAAIRSAADQPYAIDVTIEAKRFALTTSDLVRGWLDATAAITGQAGREGVDARLAIRRAAIELADAPSKDVQSLDPHPDFVVVRGGRGRGLAARRLARAKQAAQQPADAIPVSLQVVTERPIEVEGTDVEVTASADLRMLLQGGLQMVGSAQVERGHVLVLNKRFELSSGRVYYTGAEAPGNPRLHVVAVHEGSEAQVTVTVGGTASKPTISLRSNPPYSEAQIAELLATGRLSGGRGGSATGAASAVGTLLGAQLKNGVASKLPLDVLSFQAGEQDAFQGSRVEAGTYLTDKIYVGYAHRFGVDKKAQDPENEKEVRFEYLLAPRWTLEVTYGDAAVGGADLMWTRDF